MENDIFVKYDSLCMATLTNVYTLTKEHNAIHLKGFDWSNDEHKFFFCVLVSCHGVLEKPISVDASWLTRRGLQKKYGDIIGKVGKTPKNSAIAIDVQEVLEYMRQNACEICGESFRFGDIYHAYYKGEKEKE